MFYYMFIFTLTGEIVIQPGVYSYMFQCSLPPGLPTSVEAETGHIRYIAKVVLNVPGSVSDVTFEEAFTVIKPLNLNSIPSLRVRLTLIYLIIVDQ